MIGFFLHFIALMEKVCGGEISDEVGDLAGRKTTSVEWRFHRRITDLLLKNLKDAMSFITAFDIEILKSPKEVSRAQ